MRQEKLFWRRINGELRGSCQPTKCRESDSGQEPGGKGVAGGGRGVEVQQFAGRWRVLAAVLFWFHHGLLVFLRALQAAGAGMTNGHGASNYRRRFSAPGKGPGSGHERDGCGVGPGFGAQPARIPGGHHWLAGNFLCYVPIGLAAYPWCRRVLPDELFCCRSRGGHDRTVFPYSRYTGMLTGAARPGRWEEGAKSPAGDLKNQRF